MNGVVIEVEVKEEFSVVGGVGGLIEACGLGENVAVGVEGLNEETSLNVGSDFFLNVEGDIASDFNGDVARDLSLNGS